MQYIDVTKIVFHYRCAILAWCVRINVKKERSANSSLSVTRMPSTQYQMIAKQATDADSKDSSDDELPGTSEQGAYDKETDDKEPLCELSV